jgi:hypothetical protein
MRNLGLLVGVVAIVLATPPGARATTTVRFELADPVVGVGGSTTLEIRADFDAPVVGFGIDLLLDSAVFAIVGVPAIGPAWSPLFAPDGDGLAGLGPEAGIVGSDVLLASILLDRVGAAGSSISGAITPGDLTEGFPLLPSGFDTAVFLPTQVAAIPEPHTAALLGVGLAAISGRRIRRGVRRPIPRQPGG